MSGNIVFPVCMNWRHSNQEEKMQQQISIPHMEQSSMNGQPEPSLKRLKELRQTYSECVFSGSWIFTVLGLLAALPLGMRWKSYNPLVVGFLAGGAGDLYRR